MPLECALCSLNHLLLFLEHGYEIDSSQRALSRIKGPEAKHRPCETLDCALILLHDIVQIFDSEGECVVGNEPAYGGYHVPVRTASWQQSLDAMSPVNGTTDAKPGDGT